MLIGHYAPALALSAQQRRVPLWALFVGVQLVDYAWSIMVLTGTERATLVPGITPSNALQLDFMPYSHSLVATAVWALAGGALAAQLWGRTGGRGVAFVAGAVAVASHWLLDLLVHLPDLPIAAGDGTRVGLALWQHRALACALEGGLIAVGSWMLYRSHAEADVRRRVAQFGGTLLVLNLVSYYGPQPTTLVALSLSALALYSFLAALAWRTLRPSPSL